MPLVTNDRSLELDHGQGLQSSSRRRTPLWWWIRFPSPAPASRSFGLLCIGYQISTGVGVWGENNPVGWAWDITNFVFWIGIGHAGTLISAILFLTRQKWRTSINRAAEAMTLFAVICAGIFPGIHVGPRLDGVVPGPDPEFRWASGRTSAARSCGTCSRSRPTSRFRCSSGTRAWFPTSARCATARNRAVKKFLYGVFALGWRGGNRQWRHYEMAYLFLAGLSTPLVLSVHSVVSFDFATSILPGWHTTIFPPYFVAGAIFGGFAMVLTILLPARLLYPQLKDIITTQHVDKMAKIILPHRLDRRLRLPHGVVHRLVQHEPLREIHLLPRARQLRPQGLLSMGLLEHDVLQRHLATGLLVQEMPQ